MNNFFKSLIFLFFALIAFIVVDISKESSTPETKKLSKNEIETKWLKLEDKKVVHFKDENVCWIVRGNKDSVSYSSRYSNASIIDCSLFVEPTENNNNWLKLEEKKIIYFKEDNLCYGVIGTKGAYEYSPRYFNSSIVNCELVKDRLVN